MFRLFRLPSATERDVGVDAWFEARPDALGVLAREWFQRMRACGDDVRVLLHDGHPTACVGDAAFAYVDAFTSHVSVGFFVGPELPDPEGVLEGTGKYMRHVKLRPGREVDRAALGDVIAAAYRLGSPVYDRPAVTNRPLPRRSPVDDRPRRNPTPG